MRAWLRRKRAAALAGASAAAARAEAHAAEPTGDSDDESAEPASGAGLSPSERDEKLAGGPQLSANIQLSNCRQLTRAMALPSAQHRTFTDLNAGAWQNTTYRCWQRDTALNVAVEQRDAGRHVVLAFERVDRISKDRAVLDRIWALAKERPPGCAGSIRLVTVIDAVDSATPAGRTAWVKAVDQTVATSQHISRITKAHRAALAWHSSSPRLQATRTWRCRRTPQFGPMRRQSKLQLERLQIQARAIRLRKRGWTYERIGSKLGRGRDAIRFMVDDLSWQRRLDKNRLMPVVRCVAFGA